MGFNLNRRGLLGSGVAASLLTAGGWAHAQSHPPALSTSTIPIAPFVEVDTPKGRVRGGTARGALSFKGIPYTGPLGGANRFRAPTPVPPWSGVFDALRLGAPALQKPKSTYGEQEPGYSEDCGVLNVWTPAIDGRKRPVMVYLHGGGFVTGSAGSTSQDGGRLAAVHDVVVVACNHRLGLLGYLWVEGGDRVPNVGMLDIVAALEWVRDTISAFGGDPGNVTIFGESGGGGKVGTLMAMPAAKGLFHKAIIQSGAWPRRFTAEAGRETTRRVMKALNLTDPAQLDKVPAQALLDLQLAADQGQGPLIDAGTGLRRLMAAGSDTNEPGHFGPIVDGAVLPAQPFDPKAPALSANIPLIVGWDRDEATFFNMGRPDTFTMDEAALKRRLDREFGDKAPEILAAYRGLYPKAPATDVYIAIASARVFGNDSMTTASLKSDQAAPVWLYRYDYESNFPIAGTKATLKAGHASDIGSTFFNWDLGGLHGNGPGLEQASRNLSTLLTTFARTGKPSAKGVPEWPTYDRESRATLLVNTTCRVENDPEGAARRMWGAG
jgi:para-nitrobenzyl esterase